MKKKTIIKKIDNFLEKMFKVNRSLAGAENRKTLYEIKKIIPIKIKSIKSNKKIYDWKVPKEWSIKDGYIKDMKGVKIVDFKQNNLHVASYSQPVNKICNWAEIKKKLIYSKKLKKGIPYRTTYYSDNWMFCCNFKQYQEVRKNKKVKIRIDSKFINGKMNYGELLIKGKSKKEILISTYICHPSMANDNLSGIILTSILAQLYSWRYSWLYNDIESYLQFYANDFKREDGMILDKFKKYKTRIFKKQESKSILFNKIAVIPYPDTKNIYQITFEELYKSKNFKFIGEKILMVRLDGSNNIKIFTEK